MLRTLSALAVVLVALPTPSASASHPTRHCRFTAVSQATVTGEGTFEGVAEGVIVGAPEERLSIRCGIFVNGAMRAATPTARGIGAAATAGRVTYTRTGTEFAYLCLMYTTAHDPVEVVECYLPPTPDPSFPPRFVYDLLESVGDGVWGLVDPALCPVIESANGSYGPVEVKPGAGGTGGDVWVADTLVYDCPEYEPTA